MDLHNQMLKNTGVNLYRQHKYKLNETIMFYITILYFQNKCLNNIFSIISSVTWMNPYHVIYLEKRLKNMTIDLHFLPY